jgi:hypothetical protein
MSNPTAAAVLAMHLATYPVHATLPVTNSVDSGITPPAPQTQAAPAASSDPVFANQPVQIAPEIPPISRDEQFRQNAAVMDALAKAGIAILTECRFTKYAHPLPEQCIAEEISSEIDGYQEENIKIAAEQVDAFLIALRGGNLKTLGEKGKDLHALVDSANTR